MLRIEQAYLRLMRNILDSSESVNEFYSQIKRTPTNRRTLDNIGNTISTINKELDYELSGFLYKDERYYQLDIYSEDCYEGSIRDSNLKQLADKLRGLYLKLKQKFNL